MRRVLSGTCSDFFLEEKNIGVNECVSEWVIEWVMSLFTCRHRGFPRSARRYPLVLLPSSPLTRRELALWTPSHASLQNCDNMTAIRNWDETRKILKQMTPTTLQIFFGFLMAITSKVVDNATRPSRYVQSNCVPVVIFLLWCWWWWLWWSEYTLKASLLNGSGCVSWGYQFACRRNCIVDWFFSRMEKMAMLVMMIVMIMKMKWW